MECPYCKSRDTFSYYKAQMPNILAACPENMHTAVRLLPIEARLCRNCGLGFNSSKLSNEDLNFIYDNYCYISPLHGIGCSKYEGMIATLNKYSAFPDKIVEIGCSEGYLLSKLKEAGYTHLIGIEPGPQANTAESLGLTIIRDYYTENTFLTNDIDVFFLMHVFEHFEDPFTILDTMIAKLAADGKIIIEVPNFEGYHHQHLFYYTIPFFARLGHDKKLKIVEIIEDLGSLRVVFVRDTDTSYAPYVPTETIDNVIERARKIQSHFRRNIDELESVLRQNAGKTLYWWGAGSASTILLNQIDRNLLDTVHIVVVDGDANKVGNYIPGVHFRINSIDVLKIHPVDTLVIASSFFREITEVIRNNSISVKAIKNIY